MIPIMESTSNPSIPGHSHRAHYMVLLGPTDAPRALLFSDECRYLAEMFDEDGLLVENLVKCSRVCPPPSELRFDGVVPAPASPGGLRCYELTEEPARAPALNA